MRIQFRAEGSDENRNVELGHVISVVALILPVNFISRQRVMHDVVNVVVVEGQSARTEQRAPAIYYVFWDATFGGHVFKVASSVPLSKCSLYRCVPSRLQAMLFDLFAIWDTLKFVVDQHMFTV